MRKAHRTDCQCCVCKNKRREAHNVDCNCIACQLIKGIRKGKNAMGYKHGKYIRKRRCSVCNKLLSPLAKACSKHKLFSLETREKMRQSRKNIEISLDARKKIGLKTRERYRDENYRIKMGLAISKGFNTPESMAKRSEITKNLWKRKDYRNKVLINMFKGLNLKPNKPEKFLLNLFKSLFPNQYKYTGNGAFFIERYNPDFVDFKNKRIIEFYGAYWHNRPDYQTRDKRRLQAYKKHKYKTLIIWDEELKDLDKLQSNLLKFN